MPDTVAKIRAKGLDATGVTEDLAEEMYNTLGRHTIAIVELKHEAHGRSADGSKKVELILTMVEPAVDGNVEDHLRELTRTMHQNRALRSEDQQLAIATGDDIAPKVADVLAHGQAHLAHDYVADDTDPAGGCEICEKASDDPIHTLLDDLPTDLSDPEPDDGDEDQDQDQDDEDPDDTVAPGPDQPNRPLSSVPDPFTA